MNLCILDTCERDDRPHVEIIAIILEPQRITALHLFDEFPPSAQQPGASLANDALGISVLPEIILDLSVSHSLLQPFIVSIRPGRLAMEVALAVVGFEESSDGAIG